MNYKIAQLMLSSTQKGKTTSDIFVAQEDGHKEDLAGKLFVLIEIESGKSDNFRIIDFLINSLNRNYYQNEKILLRERVSTLQVEHIFESALIKTTKALVEFVKNEKIEIDPKLINATVGIIYNNEIHFTNLGKNKAILIHKRKDDQYQLTDITEKTRDDDEQELSLTKLFPSIVSGSIPAEGYFIATNEALPEYISSRQLTEIITTLPPSSAVEQIKNSLGTINDYITFLAIIAKNSFLSEKSFAQNEPAKTSHSSIQNLNNTEQNTENLLSPSGIINLKKSFNWQPAIDRISAWFSQSKRNEIGNRLFLTQQRISFNQKSLLQKLQKFGQTAKDALIYVINTLIYLLQKIWNFRTLLSSLKNFGADMVAISRSIYKAVLNMSKKQKIAAGVAVACLLLFSGNLYIQNKKNKQAAITQHYADITQQIEKKQNEIDASLLYKNNDRAKSLFDEINSLMSELPQNYDGQKEKADQFKAKYEEQIRKISKMETIAAPTILVDWTADGASLAEIAMTDKRIIYAMDNDNHVIRNFDIAGNKGGVSPVESEAKLYFPSTGNDNEVYFYDNSNLSEWNKGKLTKLTSTPALSTLDLIDMFGFNNRIYAVDKKTNQILKYDKITKNGAGTPWLKDPVDMSNARNISIDGKLYLLAKDNIQVFANGKKEDLTLDTITPTLEDATKLQTSSLLNQLYVLEPKNKRLIIFNKSGKLLVQYTSDRFDNLRDIAIDETAKKIYVLNGAVIFSIDIAAVK